MARTPKLSGRRGAVRDAGRGTGREAGRAADRGAGHGPLRGPGPAFESGVLRAPATRPGRDRLLVVCGAKVTEKHYLQGLVEHLANPAVTVRIRTKPCSPAQLIAYAAGERDRAGDDFDQVWCVFDVDEYEVGCAVTRARREGIEVAVSNPCFELWLVLHFCDHKAHVGTYRELLPYLKRYVPAYDKARLDFRDYEHGWPSAGSRAVRLAEAGHEHATNPSTGVWALVDRIAGR
ncbi:RloB family protein [Streptomyces albireticuli]|uniref:RloB n=1 Tax=Streptomyces albireticuli TaxID=1940 RepID=A0A2A2D136_9ACTN|nr:RloB family protein [Streptomyces albireticuli]MCD9143917.1 RloB family protein [Streptomyces albireticuli]MCD9161652.1 RloB family protein [Streptomyces albireticuli]MCD9192034.1 RloB family protein [Streptomyces albireticuli]PAU45042.1 RloB [Streptomyces albireticuli]